MSRVFDPLRRHFAVGPILAYYLDRAADRDPLMARNAWDEGVAVAASSFDRPRSWMGAVQTGVGVVTGWVVAGVDLHSLGWPIQAVLVFLAGVAGYWMVPTVLAFLVALAAPPKQRESVRKRLVIDRQRYGAELAAARAEVQAMTEARRRFDQRANRRRDVIQILGNYAQIFRDFDQRAVESEARVRQGGISEAYECEQHWKTLVQSASMATDFIRMRGDEFGVPADAGPHILVMGREDAPPRTLAEVRAACNALESAVLAAQTLVREAPWDWS